MVKEIVREYYGKTLQGTEDLKTSACCSTVRPPDPVVEAMKHVHPEISGRFYGCGVIVPDEDITGWSVLDLGSGAGMDAYVLAQLVGQGGSVVGVDMTREQLAIAREYEDWHRDAFGYETSNVRFIEGEVDKLGELDLQGASVDLTVSNCVINLVPDKAAVFQGVSALLKPDGRFLFSDVFVDREIPSDIASDPVIIGECLGGAMTVSSFETMNAEAGFGAPEWKEIRPLDIEDEDIAKKLENFSFESRTVEIRRKR